MKSVSCIYIIINKKNGKMYIGQARDTKRRWRMHKSALNNGSHKNQYLQRAWDKHGEKSFIFKILEYCSIEQLDEREQHYLNIYIPKGICYNIATNVRSPARGIKRSEDWLRKMSEAAKGNKNALGFKRSEETRRKDSEANKRRPPMSNETRARFSEAAKKREAKKRGELGDTS